MTMDRQRPDLLTRNVNRQGLLAIIADLEKRADSLEKQWRKATAGSGSGSSSGTSLTTGEIMTAIRGERGPRGATGPAGATGAAGTNGADGSPGATGATAYAYGTVLQNEIKGWPCLMEIGAGIDLVTLNQWFDDVGTPTTKASAVPVSGEAGLQAKFTHVIKCITDAADEGWRNHRFTFADEPRIKSGAHISALVWLGSTAGGVDCTAKLVNSDATETVGTVVATDGDWDLYFIENHVCAGTYVDFQVTKDTSGTFYAGGRITVMIGENAILLSPRHGVYRLNADAATAVENLTGSTKAIADLDLAAASSPLAYQGSFHVELAETSTGSMSYCARPNGSTWGTGFTTSPAVKALVEPSDVERMTNDFELLFDDLQIIETAVTASAGTPDNARLYLVGWWEWE